MISWRLAEDPASWLIVGVGVRRYSGGGDSGRGVNGDGRKGETAESREG